MSKSNSITRVSLGEVTGYLTGLLFCGLDGLPAINVCGALGLRTGTLLTGAMEQGAVRVRYDKACSSGQYIDHVLRDALSIAGTTKYYSVDKMVPDLFYYEMLTLLALRGPGQADKEWNAYYAVSLLPHHIAAALIPIDLRLKDILSETPSGYYGLISPANMLLAASRNADPAYMELAASLMDPQFYGRGKPGEAVDWVSRSMAPNDMRSASRICALAKQILGPHTLLLSTLGCTSIIVEEALREPQKYGISAVLDDAAFDEYAYAAYRTSIYREGGPVASNLRALLSMYPPEAARKQLEHNMSSMLWYGETWEVPDSLEWAKAMILKGLLEACAPYVLSTIPNYARFFVKRGGDGGVAPPVKLRNFYAYYILSRGAPGITLGSELKKALTIRVMRTSMDHRGVAEKYATGYAVSVGPTDKAWLETVMRTEFKYGKRYDISHLSWLLELMSGSSLRK